MKILDVVIEEKVPAVLINSAGTEGHYGVEKGLMEPCKKHGIKMVVRAWQASIADAKKCEEQGVDVYVATGFDEGGTIPAASSFIHKIKTVQEVVDDLMVDFR